MRRLTSREGEEGTGLQARAAWLERSGPAGMSGDTQGKRRLRRLAPVPALSPSAELWWGWGGRESLGPRP